MKKRIIWLVVSCLMVTALVLAACAPAAPTEVTPTPEKEVTPTPEKEAAPTPEKEVAVPTPQWIDVGGGVKIPKSVEVPKYGGTYNVGLPNPSQGFDDTLVQQWWSLQPILTNDLLLMADRTRGLGGTGEVTYWWLAGSPPRGFEAPHLAERWETPDANTMVFYIRKGVHFALNPNSEASRLVGGRELTAEDVAFNIERQLTSSQSKVQPWGKWFRSVEVDGNKVTIRGQDSPISPALEAWRIYDRVFTYPPEVIQKYGDMVDWRNSVGTGPFMLVDYISASVSSFVRNPNYWKTEVVGPGKGMQLPFVDAVKWLDLRDLATRLAAFRTGKIDWELEAEKIDADRLLKDNPKLIWIKKPANIMYLIHMRTDKPELPFYDVRVRRALAMAVNQQEVANTLYQGDAEVYGYLLGTPGDPYSLPFEELPRQSQMTLEYHPEEAKKLLTEAGYPNGFKTNIVLPAYPEIIDMLSMYKAYWAKNLNVDMTLDPREFTVFNSMRVSRTHTEMMVNRAGTNETRFTFGQIIAFRGVVQQNLSIVDDPYINERYGKIWAWENAGNDPLRIRLYNEVFKHAIEQAYLIAPPRAYIYRLWWPWLKNYQGEYSRYWRDAEFVWIDQELKKAMGFK